MNLSRLSILKFYSLLFLLFSSATLYAQTDKEQITTVIANYFKVVEQKDNQKTLDFMYPRLFDLYPKQKMLEAMDRMKEDTTVRIDLANYKLQSVSDILEVEGVKYSLVKYSFNMTMTFSAVSPNDEDGDPLDFTFEVLKEKYGEKNVSLDKKARKIAVQINNEMYAIKDAAAADWKFLEKQENMKPLLEKLLPKKVLKEL